MKILFLAPYAPFPPRGGGQQRMYHMLRLLGARHDVHLLTMAPEQAADAGDTVALDPLRAYCQITTVPVPPHRVSRRLQAFVSSSLPDMVLRGAHPAFAAALARLLARHDFDVVQLESIEMAPYGRGGSRHVQGSHRALWSYDAFNVEYLLQRRACLTVLRRPRTWPVAFYSWVQWQKLRRFERRLATHADLILAVSDGDRHELQRLTDSRLPVVVVPNGVDTSYFDPNALDELNPDTLPAVPYILFTGTLDFRPNVDAVQWFVRSVWSRIRAKRPDLRFLVVGQRPTASMQALRAVPGVEIVGAVEDIRPWFARAGCYILPMRIGGGVRLKLLETWAMGLPCVTTTLGSEGVAGFIPGIHALVADDAEGLAAAVELALDDQATARRLAEAGRQLVLEHYDWQPIVAGMEQVYEQFRSERR